MRAFGPATRCSCGPFASGGRSTTGGGNWADLSRRWRDSLPLPDPAVADRRAAAARKIMEVLREMGDQDAFRENRLTWLTHRARASLIRAGVHPLSRPELPAQLRELGDTPLAASLRDALAARRAASS